MHNIHHKVHKCGGVLFTAQSTNINLIPPNHLAKHSCWLHQKCLTREGEHISMAPYGGDGPASECKIVSSATKCTPTAASAQDSHGPLTPLGSGFQKQGRLRSVWDSAGQGLQTYRFAQCTLGAQCILNDPMGSLLVLVGDWVPLGQCAAL